jgi:hypothetical protein
MIFVECEQGTEAWLRARAGVCTASRFKDARAKTGGLDEKQAAYVDAIKRGADEATARVVAGYKAAPRAEVITRALQGLPVTEPADPAIKYAWTIAMEHIAGEPLDDTFVTWQMRRGTRLEPDAREAYEIHTGAVVLEAGIVLTDDRLFGYSTDGFVGSDGMVEIKCPAACDKLGEIWTNQDHAEDEYIDQINGGLWITGRKWCDLIVYCPWLEPVGKELFIKRIHRNENAIQSLEDDLMAFKAMVDRFEAQMRKTEEQPEGAAA